MPNTGAPLLGSPFKLHSRDGKYISQLVGRRRVQHTLERPVGARVRRSNTCRRPCRIVTRSSLPEHLVIPGADRRIVKCLVDPRRLVEDRVAELLGRAQTWRRVVQVRTTDRGARRIRLNLVRYVHRSCAIPAGANAASAPPAAKPPITVRVRRDPSDMRRCFAIQNSPFDDAATHMNPSRPGKRSACVKNCLAGNAYHRTGIRRLLSEAIKGAAATGKPSPLSTVGSSSTGGDAAIAVRTYVR